MSTGTDLVAILDSAIGEGREATPEELDRVVSLFRRKAWEDRLRSLPMYVQLAYIEAIILERNWREASIETKGDWPAGHCAEASADLYEVLLGQVPKSKPVYVWGHFELLGHKLGHAWVELRDGTIIDLTAGQFFKGEQNKRESTWLVLPTDATFERYLPEERNPKWTSEIA